jgi:hypothetical protein
MSRIFVPSTGPGDWQRLLADTEKHWARGHSAHALAHCWENAAGFPAEIRRVLSQNAVLASAEPLLILPEWKVPLPGGSRPSQNDIWVLARSEIGLISIALEGKAEEPFGPTLGEWRGGASHGKGQRLAWLRNTLGLDVPIPESIRYQLLHRTASALAEAERFGARRAIMLVHSFSAEGLWFDDFRAFTSLFGLTAIPDHLLSTALRNGLPLHLAWVRGDSRFLSP